MDDKSKLKEILQKCSKNTGEWIKNDLEKNFPCEDETIYDAMYLYIITNYDKNRSYKKDYDEAKLLLKERGFI